MLSDEKRKELEELRKQINPEILKKVAGSMGVSVPGMPSTPQSSPSAPSSYSTTSDLAELKAKIKRSENANLKAEDFEKKKSDTTFVLFDPSRLETKKLSVYLNQMGYYSTVQVSSVPEFLKHSLIALNSEEYKFVAGVSFANGYPLLRQMFNQPEIAAIVQKMPALEKMPIYLFLPGEASISSIPEGVSPQRIVSMRLSPSFNLKKIKLDLKQNPL